MDRKPSSRAGIIYHDLVNTVRQQIPATVQHLATKVTAIAGDGGDACHACHGRQIEARLVILANGLNPGLRENLEISREC